MSVSGPPAGPGRGAAVHPRAPICYNDGVMSSPHDSPCLRHGCDLCCHDTRMSLTEADERRLRRAGHTGFCRRHRDGTLRLRNVGGRCVFLRDGRCAAYPDRPDGCVLYPLIWFVDSDEADLHDFCPHRHEFRFTAGDREWLRRSIATEDAEVAARLAAGRAPLAEPPGDDAQPPPEGAE